MRQVYYNDGQLFDFSGHQLLITYAEEGFSPLSIHMKSMGYEKEEIINFSNSINENDEPKSLLPDFPLFAIPRRFIREHFEFYELSTYFTEIILNSVENNNFKQIVFDFRTPQTSNEIKRTIARFLEDKKFVNLTSFGFIENNESNISDLELSIIKFILDGR